MSGFFSWLSNMFGGSASAGASADVLNSSAEEKPKAKKGRPKGTGKKAAGKKGRPKNPSGKKGRPKKPGKKGRPKKPGKKGRPKKPQARKA